MKRPQRRCRVFFFFLASLFLALTFLVLNISLFEKSTVSNNKLQVPFLEHSSEDATISVHDQQFHSCFDTKNKHWRLPAVPHFIIAGVQKGGTSALRGMQIFYFIFLLIA
jgi:hypothetical protein